MLDFSFVQIDWFRSSVVNIYRNGMNATRHQFRRLSKLKFSAFVAVENKEFLIFQSKKIISFLDQIEERTPVVAGNGLNPIWNHPIQFSICFPELSIVRFSVRDSDKSNTELGQYSIPFLSMQQGYRHVRLLDGHNTPTKATIFIHVRIDNMEKWKQKKNFSYRYLSLQFNAAFCFVKFCSKENKSNEKSFEKIIWRRSDHWNNFIFIICWISNDNQEKKRSSSSLWHFQFVWIFYELTKLLK